MCTLLIRMCLYCSSGDTMNYAKTPRLSQELGNHRIVKLGAVYSALSAKKAAALPSFHALSGADVTGSFAGKGKCHAEMCLVMHQRRH